MSLMGMEIDTRGEQNPQRVGLLRHEFIHIINDVIFPLYPTSIPLGLRPQRIDLSLERSHVCQHIPLLRIHSR